MELSELSQIFELSNLSQLTDPNTSSICAYWYLNIVNCLNSLNSVTSLNSLISHPTFFYFCTLFPQRLQASPALPCLSTGIEKGREFEGAESTRQTGNFTKEGTFEKKRRLLLNRPIRATKVSGHSSLAALSTQFNCLQPCEW